MKKPISYLEVDGKKYYLLCPIGKKYTNKYGVIDLNENFVKQGYLNFKNKKFPLNPEIDIDHSGGESQGVVIDMLMLKDGLYGNIEWTEAGAERVKKGLYKYFSPSIRDYIDENTGEKIYPVFDSFSLTNKPVLKYSLGEPIKLSEKSDAIYYLLNEDNAEVFNKQEFKGGQEMSLQDFFKKYNLSENSSLEDLEKAIALSKQEKAVNTVTSDKKELSEVDLEKKITKVIEKIALAESEDKKELSEKKPAEIFVEKEKTDVVERQDISVELSELLIKEREEKNYYKKLALDVAKKEKENEINKLLDFAEQTGRISKVEREYYFKLAEKDFITVKKLLESLKPDESFIPKDIDFSDYITYDFQEAMQEIGIDPKKANELRKKYKIIRG